MSDSTLSLSPLGETTSHSTRLQETAAKSLVIPSRERPQSPIFFAQIENAVAMFAIASACRAEAPLRGVPPLFKMPLRPAKIIRRNRKRSALRPASKDNGRSSKHTARLRFMGRVRNERPTLSITPVLCQACDRPSQTVCATTRQPNPDAARSDYSGTWGLPRHQIVAGYGQW